MAKRARTEPFDPVYPYGESQGPIKNGSLVITPPSSPTPAPPTDIINPVYPFGQPDNVLEDGKVVITGDATALISPGPGLAFQNGKLTVTSDITSVIPVSSPLTKTSNTITLTTGAGVTVDNNALTANITKPLLFTNTGAIGVSVAAPLQLQDSALGLSLGSGFTTQDNSLQYQLSKELSIANNALGIKKYCFAWLGIDSMSAFVYSGKKVRVYLSLERIGEQVYGSFSAYCDGIVQVADKFSINFYFNADGTLNSQSTYSGAFGPRTSEWGVGPPAANQHLLIPSSSYTQTPKVSLSAVGLNTENLVTSSDFTTATALVLYNWNVPSNCRGGITFRFFINSSTNATAFIGDLISFSYLGSY